MREFEIQFPSYDTDYTIRALIWEPASLRSSEHNAAESKAQRDTSSEGLKTWQDGELNAEALSNVKGIIQLLHGMSEHIERYCAFAEHCVKQGFIVCGHDHVGHGKSVKAPEAYGLIPKNGKDIMVEDAHKLRQLVQERYKTGDDLPYFMFGHSMGSFVLRVYISEYGEGLAGAIPCGTGHLSPALSGAGRLLSRIIHAFKGSDHKSALIDNLSTGSYAKQIEGATKDHDWLSRDAAVVDAYDADPACGFSFGAGGNIALTTLTGTIVKRSTVEAVPKELPLFFIAGTNDPVGEKGEGVKRAVALFEETGHTKVTLKLYEDMRHELLNEHGKEDVYSDVISWINDQLKQS